MDFLSEIDRKPLLDNRKKEEHFGSYFRVKIDENIYKLSNCFLRRGVYDRLIFMQINVIVNTISFLLSDLDGSRYWVKLLCRSLLETMIHKDIIWKL